MGMRLPWYGLGNKVRHVPEDVPSCWSSVGSTRSLAEREMKNENGTSHKQRKKNANT